MKFVIAISLLFGVLLIGCNASGSSMTYHVPIENQPDVNNGNLRNVWIMVKVKSVAVGPTEDDYGPTSYFVELAHIQYFSQSHLKTGLMINVEPIIFQIGDIAYLNVYVILPGTFQPNDKIEIDETRQINALTRHMSLDDPYHVNIYEPDSAGESD
ncbi:uncharacterized protein LOC116351210 [Contarinia nasturtii]|uniref:uncharacterized protein LOC116351210 n=1 Tax=Contarinia nasturtii TaxID=265458 RepID=UPI0012D45043|nr:uncharacterized protein LOC116351210 [Contarinia nasturtii]